MNKKSLILIGGGGHCKSCIDVIEQTEEYQIIGIIDVPEKINTTVLGYPVIGRDNDLHEYINDKTYFLITIGQIKSPLLRIQLFDKLKNEKALLATIISPLAYVSKHAKVDEGTIIMHNCIVNADATVGKNCIINNRALIEHDAKVGDHCHISTGAIVNGGTTIGKGTFYGSGAVCKEYSIIPEESFIKANSIVK